MTLGCYSRGAAGHRVRSNAWRWAFLATAFWASPVWAQSPYAPYREAIPYGASPYRTAPVLGGQLVPMPSWGAAPSGPITYIQDAGPPTPAPGTVRPVSAWNPATWERPTWVPEGWGRNPFQNTSASDSEEEPLVEPVPGTTWWPSNNFNNWNAPPPELDPNGGAGRSVRTGTTLDSLPSFRGIKGIKNLPGGVGTIFMSNPHVGSTFYPSRKTDQPGTSLQMERVFFQAGVPVYHNETDTIVLTSHLDATTIRTQAILPTTNQPFPSQLYSVSMGANYFHQFENGMLGGIVFDVGSASDKPFHSGKETLASGTAFVLLPQDRDAWFFGVNASTNSQVLYGIPIPGGGYFYNPSDDFQAIFGFPFSMVSWKPHPDWQLQYLYAFLTTMHARAVYQPHPDWQLYAGFDWTNENYRRVGRPNNNDHFFYYEKRLAAGWLWWFAPHAGFEVAAGYAFDRYFTEVDGFHLKGNNTVNIGNGPFISAQFDLRF